MKSTLLHFVVLPVLIDLLLAQFVAQLLALTLALIFVQHLQFSDTFGKLVAQIEHQINCSASPKRNQNTTNCC